ncbi:hypothetical protein, variant [Aphanomyces invadans]|uniref:Uncharacterized protein n=1 Tax=Aphanomyces invadans TaxID=157072 RepID=A0A024TNR3_9STRA|nr:hypothetical protein, variant [Aphanomyces invadans]ETV95780.1 hypothetical protein, variant [Aphanomyces invadans]|eukprot:XP_008875530.1 hypothetical protein, variant [Aphanomyces invadans]
MLRGGENSVPTDAAAAAEPGPLPYVRKRSLQHVATHDDRLRVMTWMLAKEQTLLSESDSDGTSSAVKSDASSTKMAKVDRLCLATQAIAEFPHLFRGSAQANYMKASRWWKESREYIYGTAGMTGSKKARTGRGRKTNAWTLWLQEELKATLEMERSTTTTWHNKDLLVMAKSILDNSTHPEFNKDYIVPQRNCALGDLVNLRWVQNFKEKFQRQHAGHHHDGSAMAFAGHAYPPRQTDLDEAMEAKLLQTLATIRATKDGPLVKKEVMHMANQLIREAHPMFKVDTTWYRGFCDRHPELAVASSAKDMPQRLPVVPDLNTIAMPLAHAPAAHPSDSTPPFHTTTSSLVIDESKAADLFRAISAGHFNTVKSLLLQGASPEGCDENGCTALIVATRASHFNMVKVLLDCGAKTEATDEVVLTNDLLA